MKKIIASLTFLLAVAFAVNTSAQQVIASAGDYFEGNDISISWTLGEPVIETFQGNDLILTQGFQQPYDFYLTQVLNIPAGWSGISGYLDPLNKGVEDMFSPYIPDFIILASMTEFYYPDGGVNTINDWSWQTGYQIKAENDFELSIVGTKIDPPEVDLAAGWNLIPVLTPCGAATDELFAGMTSLNIVKEVAGTNVYWPAYGIGTLTDLAPGKAYWLSTDDASTFTYPDCSKSSFAGKPQGKPANYTPWNDLNYTAVSHAVAFPSDVLRSGGLQVGDYIGAFTPDGYCAGRAEITDPDENIAVLAFADDEITSGKDGFDAGEMLQFKVYRPAIDKEYDMTVYYDAGLPQQGIFMPQGMSAVKSVTVSALGTDDMNELVTEVYPNPSKGIFTLTMSYWPKNMSIRLMDTKGRVLKVFEPGMLDNGAAFHFDLSYLPKGVYFLKLMDEEVIGIKKVVIN